MSLAECASSGFFKRPPCQQRKMGSGGKCPAVRSGLLVYAQLCTQKSCYEEEARDHIPLYKWIITVPFCEG